MGEAERVTPERLADMARGLEPAKLEEVADFIDYLKTKQDRELPPVLRDAPLDDEPLTAAEIAEIEAARAEGGAIPLEQLKAELGL